MADNNSHCFRITNSSFSFPRIWHGLGLAIDINPLVNPCIYIETKEGEPKYVPANAEKYLDRNLLEKGIIKPEIENVCYNAFVKREWEWGGNWVDTKDLHHFQKFPRFLTIPRKYKNQNQ